jgi:hypothetical protein
MHSLNVPNIMHDMKTEPVGAYLESEHRNFALYTIQQRAITFFSGLKPVQQRCLWQLRNINNFEKVAKLTGLTMSLHPHGDCIDYNSEILLADGNYIKIGEWVEKNYDGELLIKAFDIEQNKFVDTVAKPTNGKMVDELIEIEMENGEILKVSLDHKVLLDDGATYIEAKDLTENHSIKSL